MLTSKGYATVEAEGPPSVGSLGPVGGVSTSDTIAIKQSFPNSPLWQTNEEYTYEEAQGEFGALVTTGKVEKGYLFPEGVNRNFKKNAQDANGLSAFGPPPAMGRSSAESQSESLTLKTSKKRFEGLVMKGVVSDYENGLYKPSQGYEFSSFNRDFSVNKETATGLTPFGASPALGRSSDTSQGEGQSTEVGKDIFKELLDGPVTEVNGDATSGMMGGTFGAIDLGMRRNAFIASLQGNPGRGLGTYDKNILEFFNPAISESNFEKLVLQGWVKDKIDGDGVAGYDFSSFNLNFDFNEFQSATLNLPLAPPPGMGRWKDDSAAQSLTKKTTNINFDRLVLRGGVIGGYEFPEGVNRNYTGGNVAVGVTEHNLPGDAFVITSEVEYSHTLQASSVNGPPDIEFGNIPANWEPGDPANAFTPNPSSAPHGDYSKQYPPPPTFMSNDLSWKSRPPFIGAGTDLSPAHSSEQIGKHTLGSYILGSSGLGDK
jgi:hypothetical protein